MNFGFHRRRTGEVHFEIFPVNLPVPALPANEELADVEIPHEPEERIVVDRNQIIFVQTGPETPPRIYMPGGMGRREEVNARAWDRLMASLSEQQQRSVRENGWFEIKSNLGNRWRIATSGFSANCIKMNNACNSGRPYCAHLRMGYHVWPLGDHLLAQALMIRTDEDRFIRIAHGGL